LVAVMTARRARPLREARGILLHAPAECLPFEKVVCAPDAVGWL